MGHSQMSFSLRCPQLFYKNISRNFAPKMKAPDIPLILSYAGINNSKQKAYKCEITEGRRI